MRRLQNVVCWLLVLGLTVPASAFRLTSRWTTTATDGTGIAQGDPITITWSLAPDGTTFSGAAGGGQSDLIGFLDNILGAGAGGSDFTQRPWFPLIDESFNRIGELSGATYVYEPNDDGAVHSSGASRGILGVRGDVRIAGKFLDGNSGVLAFNFFPNNGDMTLDTGDANFYRNPASDFRRLRNIIMHEHGHGLGLSHVESTGSRFLMEPFLDTVIDGPQLDDILGIQRGYGDALEKSNNGAGNDTAANASSLGSVGDGQTISRGLDARNVRVFRGETDFLSIDDNSDRDFFSFSVDSRSEIDILLTPVGPTYNEGPQNGRQSPLDSSSLSNLSLALFDTDGTSILQDSSSSPIGEPELIEGFSLDAGEYFLRVTGAQNNVQLYEIAVSATSVATEVDADFTDDGLYDCADIDSLVAEVVAGTNDSDFDLNGDGVVSEADVTQWLADAGAINLASGNPYLPGDANLSGAVDVSDFNTWNANRFTNVPAWCSGDFNASGVVDVSDFNLWNTNRFQQSDAAAVPEPISLGLLAQGLLLGLLLRRRRAN